ncbi:ComEC family competence protein [Allorhizobium sp. BGMRC 0089]|uniref:ComEC/Rec2 family competence protein n=1 Tax=Allorhizobium sonneratiae TaxID=2934936 RepID=UPI0020348926|nr:ComEC/Rec2 family competence protein [Allorhizobium sonneratiae]MCM2293743.1 ComEC family competence protein [Allorhizobium sonneratiae]
MADSDEWTLVREPPAKGPVVKAAPWISPVQHFSDEDSLTADPVEDILPSAPLLPSFSERFAVLLRQSLRAELAQGRAFLFAPVVYGTGAIWWLTRPDDLSVWPLLIFASLAILGWHKLRYRHPVAGLLFGAASFALLGMVLASHETFRAQTILLDEAVTTTIRGQVISSEENASGNQRYVIDLIGTEKPELKRMPQRVALVARSSREIFRTGDIVEGRARLSPPSGPALPGLTDFAFNSYFDGIGAIGYFYAPPKRADTPAGWLQDGRFHSLLHQIEGWTQSLRDVITNRIRRVVPGDPGAFAAAIVTGERRGLSSSANEALRISGLAHIISISGLHMALAGGLFFIGIRKFLSLIPGLAETVSTKKIAAAGAIATTTAYFCISGYDVAAQRSYLMMVIILAAAFFNRSVLSLRNAAFAALLVILISPSQILGPSLQMSFSATFALISGFALWTKRPKLSFSVEKLPFMTWIWPLLKRIGAVMLTSAIGGLSTSLYSAGNFHRIGLNGIEANLMAEPLISLIVMPSAMIGMILMPLGLDYWPLLLMGKGLSLVLDIGYTVASWQGVMRFDRFDPWFLPVMSMGLIIFLLLHTRLRLIGLAMMLAAGGYELARPKPPLAELAIAEDGQLVGIVNRRGDDGGVSIAISKKNPSSFIFAQWQTVLDIHQILEPETIPRPRRSNKEHSSDGDTEDKAGKTKRKAARRKTSADMALSQTMLLRDKALSFPGIFQCSGASLCLAEMHGGWRIAVLRDRDYAEAACQNADLIITSLTAYSVACADHDDQEDVLARNAHKTVPSNVVTETSAVSVPNAPIVISRDVLRRTGALELSLGDRQSRTLAVTKAFNGENRPWIRHRYYNWRSQSYDLPDGHDDGPTDGIFNDTGE